MKETVVCIGTKKTGAFFALPSFGDLVQIMPALDTASDRLRTTVAQGEILDECFRLDPKIDDQDMTLKEVWKYNPALVVQGAINYSRYCNPLGDKKIIEEGGLLPAHLQVFEIKK